MIGKKLVASVLLATAIGTVYSLPVFATNARHWANIKRDYLAAWGTAHTRWDRAHCTKLSIGGHSDIAGGVESSDTNQVVGWGAARSKYWAT